MVRGGKTGPTAARLRLTCALLLFAGIISHGHGWNLPNTDYPGAFGGNRGYGQPGAAGASWNQGQFGGGPPGTVDQTVSSGFGNNQWSGDGRPLGAGSGLSSGGYNGGVGGGSGGAGNGNGAALGAQPGQGFGYNGQFPTGNYQGANNGGFVPGFGGPSSGGGSLPAGSFGGAGSGSSAGSFGGTGTGPAGAFDGTGSATGSSLGGQGGPFVGGGPAAGPGASADGAGPARPGDAGLNSGRPGSFGGAGPGGYSKGAAPAAGPNWPIGGTGPRPVDNSVGPGGSIGGAVVGPSGGDAGVGPLGGAPGSSGVPGTGTGFGNGAPTVPLVVVGVRPAVPYYGNPYTSIPLSYPGGYGAPAGFGGHGASGHPWHGVGGYVYQMPVAHINPDGSYGFSYHTPHSTRKEAGDSDGNVDGNYAFNNDGAKHNFSFTAGPDVDLRSGIGRNPSEINPADYGPQSVHSRARLPLVPRPAFDGVGSPAEGFPATAGRPQGDAGASWSNRNGLDAPRTGSGATSPNGPDDGALNVLGLPATSPAPSGTTPSASNDNPNAGNRLGVVRNSGAVRPTGSTNDRTTLPAVDDEGLATEVNTEDSTDSVDSLRGSFPYGDDAGRLNNQVGDRPGALTTRRPLQAPVEPVITRPENDPSYNFAYQPPTATREESADREGTVRGPFAYNNEAGRNDLQYLAGAGTGLRPIGGSLAVSNGLRNGAAGLGGVEPSGGPRRDGSYRFGNQAPDSAREESADGAGNVRGSYSFDNPAGRHDLQYVAGAATGFRPTGGSLAVPNGLRPGGIQGAAGSQIAPSAGGFGGAGGDGRYQFGYRAPDSEREESSDGAGNVRGSYAYNNEAGRNDLQYVAGAGTGFRPTGGSLSVPNGLGVGAGGTRGSGGGSSAGGKFSFLPASPGGSNGIPGNVNGISTHNTVTRSPQDVLPPGRWNTGNGAFATTTGSSNSVGASTARDAADESTTGNFDDTQQTTTFGGFDVGTGANPGNGRF